MEPFARAAGGPCGACLGNTGAVTPCTDSGPLRAAWIFTVAVENFVEISSKLPPDPRQCWLEADLLICRARCF
jgi:hypothetical protein